MAEHPLSDELQHGTMTPFTLMVASTPLPPEGSMMPTGRRTRPIPLAEQWGPFSHLIISGALHNVDQGETREVLPFVGLELTTGEDHTIGLQVTTKFAELKVTPSDIHKGRLRQEEVILSLNPVTFGLSAKLNIFNSKGEPIDETTHQIGTGILGQDDELHPSGVTATEVVSVSLQTIGKTSLALMQGWEELLLEPEP